MNRKTNGKEKLKEKDRIVKNRKRSGGKGNKVKTINRINTSYLCKYLTDSYSKVPNKQPVCLFRIFCHSKRKR